MSVVAFAVRYFPEGFVQSQSSGICAIGFCASGICVIAIIAIIRDLIFICAIAIIAKYRVYMGKSPACPQKTLFTENINRKYENRKQVKVGTSVLLRFCAVGDKL